MNKCNKRNEPIFYLKKKHKNQINCNVSHSDHIHLRLGAKMPMGVTFYDMTYKTAPGPMRFFSVGSQQKITLGRKLVYNVHTQLASVGMHALYNLFLLSGCLFCFLALYWIPKCTHFAHKTNKQKHLEFGNPPCGKYLFLLCNMKYTNHLTFCF